MGSVYPRGQKLWLAFNDATGKRVLRPTPYRVGQEADARAMLEEAERLVNVQRKTPGGARAGGATVADYAAAWLEKREARGVRDVVNDRMRVRDHLLPVLGATPLRQVRTTDVRALVDGLTAKGLAPRTVRNVYGVLRTMMADALMDELLTTNPCVLTRGHLPSKQDADPEWRAGAVFSLEEVEQILSAPQLDMKHRALWALCFLSGVRLGEALALRWKDWDASLKPLGRLAVARSFHTKSKTVKGTKTEVARAVPVHPTLDVLLTTWRALCPGQDPDNLIIPSQTGTHLRGTTAWRWWEEDLIRLGVRHRRIHDARRTFISLCRNAGARQDILTQVTHGARGSVMDLYTTLSWEVRCEAVACLKVELATQENCYTSATPGEKTNNIKTLQHAESGARTRHRHGTAQMRQENTAVERAARGGSRPAREVAEGHCSNIATVGPEDVQVLREAFELIRHLLDGGGL